MHQPSVEDGRAAGPLVLCLTYDWTIWAGSDRLLCMVRPESWTKPAGVSPARIGARASGSRPRSDGESRQAERGVESLFGGSNQAGRNKS